MKRRPRPVEVKAGKPKLVCPTCRGTGPFRYLEDIQSWREVVGMKRGKLVVQGIYQTGEGYDDGDNPVLECHSALDKGGHECLAIFPLPCDDVEFV